MPTVKKGTRIEDEPQNLTIDEIDNFLSTTARLTADAPFQVLSDGQYIYVFRQSIAGNHSDTVYKLTRIQGAGSSGDTTRDNADFVLSDGNKVPIVNNTLLLDRFILQGTQLQPKMEVRYQRSRNKTQPANAKDSLGAKDMEGNPFYEPTQELDFVRQLENGRFQVLLLPTQIANIQRWQIFTHNSKTSKIDSFNIERAADGLFNTKGTVYYTSPEPEYQYSVYERRAGKCPFTDEDLVPIISTEGAAESALSFDGTDDYVDLGNKSELKITGNQTIEIWLKPMSFAKRQSIFCKAYNGEGAITLEVDGKLSYYYGTGGDNPSGTNINPDTFQGILSSFGLVRNEWSHIAIVRDFTRRKLSWYIDGTAAGEEIIPTTKTAATAGTENVFLGKGYADNFNGSIDEVRVWNRARSADEIKEDRHHRLVGREPGLVGYWRFDENTGTTVYDQTDSANNGTISGATWEKSDALIGNHPGMSRDSFSFSNRTIASGLTAVQYFQQEDAQVGNGQENKPMKTNARVMLAVATGGVGADGSTTTNKYVAALDLAVSREGKLVQVPDNLSLSWLNRTDLDGDSIENSFSEVASLKTSISLLKQTIQTLQRDIQSIEGSDQTLNDLKTQKQQKDEELNRLKGQAPSYMRTGMMGVPIFDPTAPLRAENDLRDKISKLSTQITQLENQKKLLDGKRSLLNQKQVSLSSKQEELERKKEKLYGQVSLPMPLLHTDSDGLTVSGALLGFAHTSDTPQLFDSAMGKLALYFQGTNEQFFTAYYDTKTARAQQVIDIGGKKVRFLARSVGAESNPATITISADDSDDTCKVTIANPQTGITETWKQVSRDPRIFSKVLNGQAKPLYLGKVAETSSTVTELTLVETTNRQLATGSVLQIGDAQVTTSAEVPVNSSSIPINSALLDVEEDTPVYLVVYDYAANASISSSAMEFDGSDDYVELPTMNLDLSKGFTVEAWVYYDSFKNYSRIIDLGNGAKANNIIFCNVGTSSTLALIIYIDGTENFIEFKEALETGKWIHLAATIDSSGKGKIFKNGEPIKSDSIHRLESINRTQNYIGKSNWSGDGYFDGKLDEVRIWNKARSAEQIQADKDRRLSGNETGLVGYWYFEGGQAKDYSSEGNDGALHGDPRNVLSPVTLINNSYLQLENGSRQFLVYSEATEGTITNGKVTSLGDVPSCRWVADAPGLALDFDGQNKYLALAQDKLAQMDATANLTMEAWVKPQQVSDVTRMIHHKSANSQYTLGLQKQDLMSALKFDGKDDYIQLPPQSLPSGKEITLSLWAYGDTYGDSTRPKVTCLIEAHNNQDERIFNIHLPWSDGKIYFDCGGDRIERDATKQDSDPEDFIAAVYKGKWSHWAFTKNADTGEMKIYYNGKLWHCNDDDDSKTGTLSAIKTVRLGSSVNGVAKYHGKIDEVRIWNYARSAEQIQADKDKD